MPSPYITEPPKDKWTDRTLLSLIYVASFGLAITLITTPPQTLTQHVSQYLLDVMGALAAPAAIMCLIGVFTGKRLEFTWLPIVMGGFFVYSIGAFMNLFSEDDFGRLPQVFALLIGLFLYAHRFFRLVRDARLKREERRAQLALVLLLDDGRDTPAGRSSRTQN